jgi:UDP-N-acetylglucosamine diphosphorylase / glucose-1-phosphate thymidylyltransferase / UDP-N-acetylgalactosamine diphosphorylase / glucosamine-1-phosphate N-acetyltransferase / galactosamine-1-phosphate N-acetyltransferase
VKAVILAAGKGTRMRHLTQARPKPMLCVQGKPILEHIVEGLLQAQIREVCLVTGWQSEMIENHFGDGRRWGAQIAYARQEVQNGTGKAADPARSFVGDQPFLLTYGDILVRPDTYRHMQERFLAGDFAGLVTATPGEDVTKGGLLLFDQDFCLTRVLEKPQPAQLDQLRQSGYLRSDQPVWYNAGIYIFTPSLFDFTARLQKSPRGEYELTDAISALVASGGRLAGLPIAGRWVDVRDPEVLAALEQGAL